MLDTLRFLCSSHKISKRSANSSELFINGFRIEHSDKEPTTDEHGIPVLRTDTEVVLRLFGTGFGVDGIVAKIGLTKESRERGDLCTMMVADGFDIIADPNDPTTAHVKIQVPVHTYELFICATTDVDGKIYAHQGTANWMKLKSSEPLLPTWVQIMIIGICLCFSALFSGLNLGLMALDRTDLKVNTKVFPIKMHFLTLISYRYCATRVQTVRNDMHTRFNQCAITETFCCAVFFSEMFL